MSNWTLRSDDSTLVHGLGQVARALLSPDKLWTRDEVLTRPSPVPKESGIYAWYFRGIPKYVPTDGCNRIGELALLYVGISPGRPPTNGKPASRQSIRGRIGYHFRGNAEGSTLRLTLGCLLQDALGIELRRVGSGKRMTFGAGENALSQWMAKNAYVAWTVQEQPWIAEEELIAKLFLPLNLDQNTRHPFCSRLSALRRRAREGARALAVLGHR